LFSRGFRIPANFQFESADPGCGLITNGNRKWLELVPAIDGRLISNKVAGIIAVWFTENHVFSSAEMELTKALAHQAMLTLQLMRLQPPA